MFARRISAVWLLVSMMVFEGSALSAEAKPATIENHRELARLLNIIKKAPQREHRTEARRELERLDVPLLDVVFVLTLDHWLLDPHPVVRYRASRQLGEMRSPARVTAVWNLRKLIAAEEDPNLKWMHAVALSSIDPNSGSAFELMNQIPHDDILHRTLFVEPTIVTTIPRFDNEMAIAEIPLSKAEYQELTTMLRLEHLGDPVSIPLLAEYQSPAPTKLGSSPRTGSTAPATRPTYPMVDLPEFAEIRRRIDQDLSKHDAMKAAALIDAFTRDRSLEYQIGLIEQIESPGGYSQEVLKYIRFHEDPYVRSAVIKALGRAEGMDRVLIETLRLSVSDENLDIRHEAIRTIAQIRNPSRPLKGWLKEILLKEDDPRLLSAAVSGLKAISLTADFQREIFQRIDVEKSAEVNLLLIECLLNQTSAQSQAHKQLNRLKERMVELRNLQTELYLIREIRWLVEEAEEIKRQANLEAFEHLQKNLILTDD